MLAPARVMFSTVLDFARMPPFDISLDGVFIPAVSTGTSD